MDTLTGCVKTVLFQ